MLEMSKAYTPKYMGEEKPSAKILALAKKITDVASHKLFKVTANDPEYWGLRCVVDDEMADIALKMDVRKPYTFEQMIELTHVDPIRLQILLNKMSNVGLLEFDYGNNYDHDGPIKDAPRIKRYILPMFVPGSAEFTNMIKSQLDEHPELAMFFERMTFIPLAGITELVPPGGAGIGMHVIPVEKAIALENKSLDIEHLSYWLKKYEGHLGVGICSCRYGRSKLNEGCGDDCEDWCISIGDMADYCRETGKGHDITYEEAMQILQNAEDNGFVHQITNIDGEEKIFAICNCNVNICNALRTSQLFNTPNLSRSAYTASVEADKCVACGKCVENCPAGAVKLGQKLCTTYGEIKYPKHELPDNLNWGEDKWDENYRDNNRINCYETGTSPCKSACPAHIAVQGYLKLASMGKYQEALALIKKDNPFPAICGRICNKRCEDVCTRGLIDAAVNIDGVKRFLADLDLQEETRYIPKPVIPSNMGKWKEKIAIIGAGPAGLSCAYFLALKGYEPVVYEKNKLPGGMLRYGIPSYKLEKNIIDAEIEVLKALGIKIKCGVEVGKNITLAQLREEGFKAFYVAIGCQGSKQLNIPHENGKGIISAVDYLKKANEKGYNLTDDKVVVIGGGNVAIDCARVASRLSTNPVKLFALENRELMPASTLELVEALDEDVKVNNMWGPKDFELDEKKNVKAVIFKRCVSVYDENKKFAPVYNENETIRIECNKVILAIGQDVKLGKLLDDSKVTYHHGNYPIADKLTYQTNQEDIFVGGDVYTGPSFAIDAIEQGHQAAESLHRYVQKGSSLTIGRNRREFIALNKDEIIISDYDRGYRNNERIDRNINSKISFKDVRINLTEEEVKKETARCLKCGASIVDENKCIGCGICTTKCAFDAIHLHRDHPEMSTMIKSEDKFKAIIPYAAKRSVKILFGKKTAEEKQAQKKHKEYKRSHKEKK